MTNNKEIIADYRDKKITISVPLETVPDIETMLIQLLQME
jgi:hypothetical protein